MNSFSLFGRSLLTPKPVFARKCFSAIMLVILGCSNLSAETPKVSKKQTKLNVASPALEGAPIFIAGNPDLGEFTSDKQQPVDFSVWQAADGTWQLWSCIRNTKQEGKNRLFHRWEGKSLTTPDWTPKGIAMQAKPELGEPKGGLQAPYTFKHDGKYHMLYGDWLNICLATSDDGKTFERVLKDGKTSQFTQGTATHIRDPMAINIEGVWHVYYTGNPDRKGKVFCQTTRDFNIWGKPITVSSGGISGDGRTAAECPHVVKHDGIYYLFRTEKYGKDSKTHVYASSDPLQFGIDNDKDYYVTTLPIAAPEYVLHAGKEYIVSTKRELNGIQVHALKWVEK